MSDDPAYRTLVERAEAGSLLVGVDRTVARKLFTDLPLSALQEKTGERLAYEKAIVMALWLAAPLAMLASVVAAPYAFGWWALLAIPLSVALFTVAWSLSSRGDTGFVMPALLVGVAVFIATAGWVSPKIGLYLVLFAVACLCARLTYVVATAFVRNLVLRSQVAFAFLAPTLQLKDGQNAG